MNTFHKTGQTVVFALVALVCVTPCIVMAQTVAKSEVAGRDMPDSEMRNHDFAFFLLLETYREFQNNLIQIDYQNRLSAAAALPDIATRKEVGALARQERDLRLKRLTAQLVVFSATCNHSRQSSRRGAGTFGAGADVKAATKRLQSFVVIAPARDCRQDADAFQTLPASAVLLNDCNNP
jgi:hypothetical protein